MAAPGPTGRRRLPETQPRPQVRGGLPVDTPARPAEHALVIPFRGRVRLAAAAAALAVQLLAAVPPLAAQSQLAPPGSPARGWVLDGAGLLPAELVSRLDARLAEHERATSDQVVVETVLSLEGRPLEDFSLGEAQRLRLGQRGRDNGVLLLVAFHDHAVRIEVGYGLEARLPDALCARILRREVLP